MEELQDKNFIRKEQKSKKISLEEVINILPVNIRKAIKKIDIHYFNSLEEIRLRIDKPIVINCNGQDYFLSNEGKLVSDNIHNIIMVNKEDILTGFQLITNYSAYAYEEEIRNGFITIKGGHRVGICGRTIIENNSVKTIKDISGLNIRISREIIGCGNKIIEYLIKYPNSVYNTLIVSPPQCGKTTILRDIVRLISNGIPTLKFRGVNVSVVDERSEIAGCFNGIPQKDVGIRTDIMDGCPKAKGMIMLIRAMAPKVIVTDEIGRDEDIYAIKEAINAGVKLITTIHGSSIDEIRRRENIGSLIDSKIFQRIIILTNKPKVGTVERIIDNNTNTILDEKLLSDRRDSFAS